MAKKLGILEYLHQLFYKYLERKTRIGGKFLALIPSRVQMLKNRVRAGTSRRSLEGASVPLTALAALRETSLHIKSGLWPKLPKVIILRHPYSAVHTLLLL